MSRSWEVAEAARLAGVDTVLLDMETGARPLTDADKIEILTKELADKERALAQHRTREADLRNKLSEAGDLIGALCKRVAQLYVQDT